MHHGALFGPLDLQFHIATFQFKLGDVLLDYELNEFLQLFLIHSYSYKCGTFYPCRARDLSAAETRCPNRLN